MNPPKNATNVILHTLMQAVWGDIWQHTNCLHPGKRKLKIYLLGFIFHSFLFRLPQIMFKINVFLTVNSIIFVSPLSFPPYRHTTLFLCICIFSLHAPLHPPLSTLEAALAVSRHSRIRANTRSMADKCKISIEKDKT